MDCRVAFLAAQHTQLVCNSLPLCSCTVVTPDMKTPRTLNVIPHGVHIVVCNPTFSCFRLLEAHIEQKKFYFSIFVLHDIID